MKSFRSNLARFIAAFGLLFLVRTAAFATVTTTNMMDFTGDGLNDIAWNFRSSGSSYDGNVWIWKMNGPNYANVAYLVANLGTNSQWMYAGSGDFGISNGGPAFVDGYPEMIWRHPSLDYTAVWFINHNPAWSNYMTLYTGYNLPVTMPPNWKVVAVGDFDNDFRGNLAWQDDITGAKVVWAMNTSDQYAGTILTNTSTGPDWRIVAAGDFGSCLIFGGVTNLSPLRDGYDDLLYANYKAGLLAIQFIHGNQYTDPIPIWNPDTNVNSFFTFSSDLDRRIVGAGDFFSLPNNTNALDGLPEIVTRHLTDGRQYIWQLDFTNFVREIPLLPHTFDTDYKMQSEELGTSLWRFAWPFASIVVPPQVSVAGYSAGPPRIDLVWSNFQFNLSPSFAVFRRQTGVTNWSTLVANTAGTNFSDLTISSGIRYDYKIQDNNFTAIPVFALTQAGVALPAVHDQGRVLLLIETNLTSQLGSSLASFTNDLIGDGWQVKILAGMPRHRDNWHPASTNANVAINSNNVVVVKGAINARVDANTKAIILLGHVTVPYSGLLASDGHDHLHTNGNSVVFHEGAWSADLFYGDIVGHSNWLDGPITNGLSLFTNENNQLPNDGKFTNDYAPAQIQLSVGRIDFARLTSFGIADNQNTWQPGEVTLLKHYLDKNHRFRTKAAPFPLPNKIIHTDYVLDPAQSENARRLAGAFFGNWTNFVTVGEPFHNNSSNWLNPRPYLWAFTSGGGGNDQIYNSGAAGGVQDLRYTSGNVYSNAEPATAFWSIFGSFLSDINLPDHFARAILAKPNYGLAVIPHFRNTLRLELLALGETLGEAFRYSINNNIRSGDTNGPLIHRWFGIQGDPTLKLLPIKPPVGLGGSRTGATVDLNWSNGEPGAQYYVYRSASTAGPYTLLTSTPISTTSYSTTYSTNQIYYMVRGTTVVTSPIGYYNSLSTGVTTTIP